ncbi:MAG: sensor domain-containing diguanylate cyclase [Pseudomonadales bacterium]
MFLSGSVSEVAPQLEAIGTPVSIWEQNKKGNFTFINANNLFSQILDSNITEQLQCDLHRVLPRYIVQQVKASLLKCIRHQESAEDEIVIERHGKVRWWRFLYSPLVSSDGQVQRVLNTCIDITEKKLLERNLETSMKRFEAVINSAYDGIISVDSDQNIKLFNQAAGDMFGIDPEQAIGQPLLNLIPGRFRHNHSDYVSGFRESPVMSRPMHTRASVCGLRSDGTEFPLEITISKIRVGQLTEMTAVLRDISERAHLIEELRSAASIDPLTDIYNRRYFIQQLENEHNRCLRFQHSFSVVMFDLDNFKQINDKYGHSQGDNTLLQVVDTVTSCAREVDVFARWGGDEFIILLPETDLEGASTLAESIRVEVEQKQAGEASPITLSLGVVCSDGRSDSKCVLQRVDELLYNSKKLGRNRVTAEAL